MLNAAIIHMKIPGDASGSQSCKMFAPDPPDLLAEVVLILGEPKLALLSNNIKDFARSVGQIGIASFYLYNIDIELEKTGSQVEHVVATGCVSISRGSTGGSYTIFCHGTSRRCIRKGRVKQPRERSD